MCLGNCSSSGFCTLQPPLYTKYACMCDANFYGQACEYNMLACSSYPCLNQGTCIDMTIMQSNDTNTNTNTSTSLELSHIFKCECRNTTFGDYCEKSIDLCLNYSCSSPHGHCLMMQQQNMNMNMAPVCKCNIDYSGEHCETEKSYHKVIVIVKTASWIIVAFSFGILITLVLLNDFFFNLFVCKTTKKKKNKMKKKKSERDKKTQTNSIKENRTSNTVLYLERYIP